MNLSVLDDEDCVIYLKECRDESEWT